MRELIIIIHNILNILPLTNNNYIVLDHNNTLNYYYNNNFYNIEIIHNLNYIDLFSIVYEFTKKNIRLLNNFNNNKNNLKLLYKNDFNKYEFNLKKGILINKVYYNIKKLEYIYDNEIINLDKKIKQIFHNFGNRFQ
jgi:hypothetical protein